jgi:LacI family transcriptional regulator
MEDVARIAGVNKATVSRSLKGDSRISPATRERVWAAAKEVGYRLDLAASSLSGGRTGLAAVVFESLRPCFSQLFFSGLNRVLAKSGMDILLKMPDFNADALMDMLSARHVDCMLLAGNGKEPPSLSAPFPFPVVTAGFDLPGVPAVVVSERETLSRLETVSGGRPLRLASGPSPLFTFLSRSIPNVCADEEDTFVILDDMEPNALSVDCDCIAALPEDPVCSELFRLEWPAFEMGSAAGRLLLKALAKKGSLPREVQTVPLLREPSGEKLLFEKIN